MYKNQGMIADIQRTSVHDGPGIRTTVFLKGCNFKCMWCHNPETIQMEPEIIYHPERCIHCGQCKRGCFSGAKERCGEWYHPQEIIEIAEEDKVYYGKDGGMTISGGEPSFQPEFLMELVKCAAGKGIQCAIETNLSMDFSVYKDIIPYIRWWMVDLKLFDEEKHRFYTGSSNRIVKENIVSLSALADKNIIVRTPVMKGVNNTWEELGSIGNFISNIQNVEYYELLPYHPMGLSKMVEGSKYIKRFDAPQKEELKDFAVRLKNEYSMKVKIASKIM